MAKDNIAKLVSKSLELGGRTLTIEVGRVAQQANAAVLARYGDTIVLVTAVASKEAPDLDYFPLSVEYAEKLYAGGRIKGSRWVKREGRPSDDAILKARLIDRSIRPLFPKDFKRDVQIIATVLSVDGENDPDILSVIAASAAVHVSDIPWNGPIAALRVGCVHIQKEGEDQNRSGPCQCVVNPTTSEMLYSQMDLVVSATREKVVMIEAGMKESPEEEVLSAISFAQKEIKRIIAILEDLRNEVGKPKMSYAPNGLDTTLLARVDKDYGEEINDLVLKRISKEVEGEELGLLADSIVEAYGEEVDKKTILKVIDALVKKQVRANTLQRKTRPDGRKPEEIRKISGEVSVLPRTHGSAIFNRGETQALTITTLAAPSLEQLIESPEGEETKRYMHHYYMPPYSVGETGRFGWPSRREVGHGALAERALLPVIPEAAVFPYTIRVVSEIMSSNGSTSMASVCGSTMSLMDAGVPIKEPIAGIAMGLVAEGDEYIILSDILGMEDFTGDMDFKVAGSKNGITAIQLDVKISGLTLTIVSETFAQAKQGRQQILDSMLTVLAAHRPQLSRYAPKVKVIRVPTDKIGEIIGPGGKVIRNIIAQTQATVDIDDDGTVTISATDQSMVDQAIAWIEGLIREVQPGEEHEGVVKRILPFGAFVEILPGKEGLVHVSQMSTAYVTDPNDIVKIGQSVKVRVVEIDSQGRINLSMLFGEDAKKHEERPRGGYGAEPRGDRRPRRPYDRFRKRF